MKRKDVQTSPSKAQVRAEHEAWLKILEESAEALRLNDTPISSDLLTEIETATRALQDPPSNELEQ